MRSIGTTAAAAVLLNVMISAQQATPTFKFERPIAVNGSGPRRLTIDVPLLSGCEPFVPFDIEVGAERRRVFRDGAGDLRLFDADGREIAYLLIPPPAQEPVWVAGRLLAVAPIETEREKTSGFEADFGQPKLLDAIRVSGVPAPFLKRVRLEGSGDRAHWTLLVADGTLFDLPEQQLRHTDLAFPAGSYQYLRLTWDDARSARVPMPQDVTARVAAPASVSPPGLTAALAFERRPSEPGRSRFRVRLPAAHLPIVALTFDVGGGHLMRPVAIYEARLSGTVAVPHRLGARTLRRVVQADMTAAELRVEIAPPSEAQLDIDVDDGDSGPLDLRGVTAEFTDLPWIYFESAGRDLVARYGNSTLAPPRYDLEAVRSDVKVTEVAAASWGEPRSRTPSETEQAGAALPMMGAAIDVGGFRYLRPIAAGDPALVRLSLDAAVLAHTMGATGSFADVRIVDGSSRQVPYLLERTTEPLSVDAVLEPIPKPPPGVPPARRTRSFYRVRLPYATLPAFRFAVSTSARVFDRRLTFGVSRGADSRHRDAWVQELASATWIHRDESTPAPALIVSIPPSVGAELNLIVDEGDNSALPLTGASILLPAYRLRFFRARGASLRLAYGRDDLAPPRYDLALLAPQLLGSIATDIDPGPESASARSTGAVTIISPRVFWAILAAAVLVLLAVIVRLLKKDDEPGGAST